MAGSPKNKSEPDGELVPVPDATQERLPSTTSDYMTSPGRSDQDSMRFGYEVVKVNKHGKGQPRRISLSEDGRTLLVTSTRIKSFGGLLKYPGKGSGARRIDVSAIDRIQRGQLTTKFGLARLRPRGTLRELEKVIGEVLPGTNLEEKNSVSIVYGGGKKSLDVIVPDEGDLDVMVRRVNDLVRSYEKSKGKVNRDVRLMEHAWVDRSKNFESRAREGEIHGMLGSLNVDVSKSTLNSIYKGFCRSMGIRADAGVSVSEAAILLDQVRSIVLGFSKVTDPAKMIWDECKEMPVGSCDEREMSEHAFLEFLHTKQGEVKATIEDVRGIFENLNELERNKEKKLESIDRKMFLNYLFGECNDAFDPIKGRSGRCDMSQPLSNYWINTSHKTYRTVDEKEPSGAAEGGANVQMYVNALYRGCRCVEADVWDGDTQHGCEPVVCNGDPASVPKKKIFESIILFSDVIKALKYFLMSQPDSYPIILSIENHCSPNFQNKMVAHLNAILDNLMYRPTQSSTLPSPEEMRGMVILRGKIPENSEKEGRTVVNDDFDCENDLEGDDINSIPSMPNDDETVETNVALRFQSVGSIVSDAPHMLTDTPEELLDMAKVEAAESRRQASMAEQYAFELQVKASQAEENASRLLGKIGLTMKDVKNKNRGFGPGRLNPNASKLDAMMDALENDEHVICMQNSTMTSVDDENKSKAMSTAQATDSESRTNATSAHESSTRYTQGTSHNTMQDGTNRLHSTETDSLFDIEDTTTEGEMELSEFMSFKTETEKQDEDEGMEVQDFFAKAVEHARQQHESSEAEAISAGEAAAISMAVFQDASAQMSAIDERRHHRREDQEMKTQTSERAMAEARTNRMHANTAAARVVTVRELLKKCKSSAGASESVCATASTEAKISEQRAADAEARATKAQATSEVEKNRADSETRKEERYECEAENLQKVADEYKLAMEKAKERVAKAIESLGEVDQRITDLEESATFKQEKKEQKRRAQSSVSISDGGSHHDEFEFPQRTKHKLALEEKKYCLEKVKDASVACNKYEVKSNHAIMAAEEAVRKAKEQRNVAAAARRQADQSMSIAEQLTEHAEEEREAASLRHIASEKAEVSVQRSDADLASMKAQLQEAERAAEESNQLAISSRKEAERLSSLASRGHDTSSEDAEMNALQDQRERAEAAYEGARKHKLEADGKVEDAKAVLETSIEVLNRAKHEAAAEVHRHNAAKQSERNAMIAYSQARTLRKKADRARDIAQKAVSRAAEVVAAERQAEAYVIKKSKVKPICPRLAKLTLMGSVKFKQWQKSLSLPYSSSHNISEGMMIHMTERGPSEWKHWMEFSKNHITRTFPSAKIRKNLSNYNPMIPWAMGCQLVSVNVQASSGMLLLVDGRFRENGSTGYVLKPERLKEGGSRVTTFHEQIEKEFPKQLSLRILSGHGLPKPEGVSKSVPTISPRVKVVLYDGVPGEGSVQHTSKTVTRNGFCPVWNEENGATFTISSPSTAMVLFTVWDRDNAVNKDFFIAASAIPFSCLRKGYRSIPLFDSNHSRSGAYGLASLLLDIDIQ